MHGLPPFWALLVLDVQRKVHGESKEPLPLAHPGAAVAVATPCPDGLCVSEVGLRTLCI